MNLVVDHEHFKTLCTKKNKLWHGMAVFKDKSCTPLMYETTKKKLIESVRDCALPLSVRGLLCPGRHGKAGHGSCNRLIGRIDNIKWLKSVIHYLENPPAKKVLDKYHAPIVSS